MQRVYRELLKARLTWGWGGCRHRYPFWAIFRNFQKALKRKVAFSPLRKILRGIRRHQQGHRDGSGAKPKSVSPSRVITEEPVLLFARNCSSVALADIQFRKMLSTQLFLYFGQSEGFSFLLLHYRYERSQPYFPNGLCCNV